MTPPVTPAELDRLLALADAATPGPWEQHEDWRATASGGEVYIPSESKTRRRWLSPVYSDRPAADAAFIAAANPDTIRALVADLRNLRAAFLEVATEAGEDTSDLDHADQLAFPTIQEFALAAVRGLREAYHEALDEPAVSA